MKKGLLILIPILIILSCGKKQFKKYEGDPDEILQQIIVENHIKMKKTYDCFVRDGKPDTVNIDLTEFIEYDKKGNVLREESYYGEGGSKFIYSYNNEGKKITTDYLDYDNNLIRHYVHIYENGLNTLRTITGPNGEKLETITYTFNKNGDCTEMIVQNIDSSESSRSEYFFDAQGRQNASKTYDLANHLIEESKMVHGNDTSYEGIYFRYNVKDLSEIHNKVKLNGQKQMSVTETIFNPKTGEGYRQEYIYNKNGLLKGIWSYSLPENKVISYKLVKYTQF